MLPRHMFSKKWERGILPTFLTLGFKGKQTQSGELLYGLLLLECGTSIVRIREGRGTWNLCRQFLIPSKKRKKNNLYLIQ